MPGSGGHRNIGNNPSGGGGRGGGDGSGSGTSGSGGVSGSGGARRSDFPLRILVLSDMVGAIIGRSGNTIRYITEETRARVDVHRKENSGSMEKVITIYGSPENCSKACEKIMEVMQLESDNTNRGEIPLKILAHNSLIGRVIGKNGATIKRIMEQTNTKITVSNNLHDVNSFNMERVIEIRGRLSEICAAEQMISNKLRLSYESDLAAMAPTMPMYPGLHPMAIMSTYGSAAAAAAHGYHPAGPTGPPPPHGRGSGPGSGPGGGGGGGTGHHHNTGGPGHHHHHHPLGPHHPATAPTGPGPSSYGLYGSPSYIPPVMPYGTPPPPQLPLAPGPGGSPLSTLTSEQTKETVYLYIPNAAVGAIIGTGGSTIRDMINSSGASIKVAQPPKDEKSRQTPPNDQQLSSSQEPQAQSEQNQQQSSETQSQTQQTAQQQSQSPSSVQSSSSSPSQISSQLPSPLSQTSDNRTNERKVTIIGTPEAQWKAQFMIFRKVGYEGLSGPQEAALKVEIMVPSNQVGRIIGKGGVTVRELQNYTHAIIKLPEEGQNSSSDETPVHIIGDFLATQAAQRQIRALVNRGKYTNSRKETGGDRNDKNDRIGRTVERTDKNATTGGDSGPAVTAGGGDGGNITEKNNSSHQV
ncbi:insulin-like growth factor 2 mRNA-binding protein 3 [Panonychus citri]|uniref:insulin-like growth factor 2 mRNA-binding protein 3 n=1 Tax=Panonychus citri TaxID=50023 RepID=UPI0023071EF9|nr:insulin-like growth factor 2 mRNA-binding protein 3 [Panonychus citri]XP_053204984.1 insulin-like growth factor 2 mRNA-binding protein 3 [Panonychus citri]XP_053204985.1 insulin-like growth factor 2 mRNA-binding protein 3 [Panonychus citri]